MEVAIIIPTMNRPDFMLRQFRFYELMNSPHPLYISDSSNEENAKKIKDSIEQFKKLNVIYQWAPPGKDHIYSLLPLVKEKYCIQIGDDDLLIPNTISECADFLELHPDYATCLGKQINIRFLREDYNKPFGIIERQTRPFGRSFDDENFLTRIKNFWSDSDFICFAVTRTEVEKKIRNITRHFSLMERLTEFLIVSILIISGKSKAIDKLGYIMQISDNRYNFDRDFTIDAIVSPDFNEKWGICEDGLSEILLESVKSRRESIKEARWIFTAYLAYQFSSEISAYPDIIPTCISGKTSIYKKARSFFSKYYLIKKLFYKFRSLTDTSNVDFICFKDFEIVKDFLEKPTPNQTR